jgi:TatD DNase family protein
MTDAHCHVSCGDPSVRELLVGRDFFGMHPWEALEESKVESLKLKVDEELRALLIANPKAGVGEIGLDRLKCRDIPPLMREVFEAQLSLAFELRRPVVLHGAKCWGQVVSAIRGGLSTFQPSDFSTFQPFNLSTFLFHGFSRSDGLIPDIVRLGGFISVGPAVLNDHAVNYRELVKKIPMDRLLVETDRTEGTCETGETGASPSRPLIYDVLAKTAELRGTSAAELERITDVNVDAFMRNMV